MKIVVFLYSMAAGGAERVTCNLVNEWSSQGHSLTVVTQKPQSADFYILDKNINRIVLNMAKDSNGFTAAIINNFKRVCMLRKIVKMQRPDIVISMMTSSNITAILASLGLCTPVIVCERTYPPLLHIGHTWHFLRRWTYPLASQVVMLTSEGLDWLCHEIPRSRGVIIPNPVVYPLAVSNPILDPQSIVSNDRKILLTVGRMSEEKGFSGLIEAFAFLAKHHPQWDLVILGDGPLRPVLKQQIQTACLGNRVFMPGQVGNAGTWYERADLYVLSSRVEGFPNTLAEAMAYGCAVVSFDCHTGPRDLIRHKTDGLLIPPGDFTMLAESLAKLMQDDTARDQMAVNALNVRSRYSMMKVQENWSRIFARYIKR